MSFAVSDSYSQHLAVVLTSILCHNPEADFVFHVLHRDFTPENQARIKELASWRVSELASCRAGSQTLKPSNSHTPAPPHSRTPKISIVFHKVDEALFEKFPMPVGLEHITQEMYYRYLLPEVLAGEDRTIYSDVDVVCEADIRPLWEMDLRGNPIGAVPYTQGDAEFDNFKVMSLGMAADSAYYASGLLVMDLAAMRRNGDVRRLFDTTARLADVIVWPDMDVLNVVFEGRTAAVDQRWNSIERYSRKRKDVCIWHFPGFTQKPWCNIWKNTTWPIYLKYLLKSPYRANAARFIWGHVKGFFWFSYVKKGVRRFLVCGIRVWKRKESAGIRDGAVGDRANPRIGSSAIRLANLRLLPWRNLWWWPRWKVPSFLMLHSVGEDVVDPGCPHNTIRPDELRSLIVALRKEGYTFKTFQDAVETGDRWTMCLTFDDGYADTYEVLFPILKELDCVATCFVTNRGDPAFPKERWSYENPVPDGARFLTAAMIREMDASGLVEFGGHTAGHTTLTAVPLEEARREIEDNKCWIEGVLGHSIVSFCYPRGENDDGIVELVKAAGYKYAAAMKKKMRPVSADFYRIHRQIIPRGMETWKSVLLATRGKWKI